MADAILQLDSTYQIVFVDWGILASNPFTKAAAHGKSVAKILAAYIYNNKIPLANIHMIGHNLGAHIAGMAAKELRNLISDQQIARITGLNPSRPLLSLKIFDYLSRNDAVLVDAVHTDTTVGSRDPVGTVDIYANHGAESQPGCPLHSHADNDANTVLEKIIYVCKSFLLRQPYFSN